MALSPTLYDFEVALSHVDRSIDKKLKVRTARHPSESLERVWLRLLAYCWLWDDRLVFGPGLSDPDAPDLLSTRFTGEASQWVRVGKTDPAKVRRAVQHHPAAAVSVLFESPQRLEAFLASAAEDKVSQLDKVCLAALEPGLLSSLAGEDERRQQLGLTVVGDHFYVEHRGATLDSPLCVRRVG